DGSVRRFVVGRTGERVDPIVFAPRVSLEPVTRPKAKLDVVPEPAPNLVADKGGKLLREPRMRRHLRAVVLFDGSQMCPPGRQMRAPPATDGIDELDQVTRSWGRRRGHSSSVKLSVLARPDHIHEEDSEDCGHFARIRRRMRLVKREVR